MARRGFLLLEILIVAAVILFLFVFVGHLNPKKSKPHFDKQTEKTIQDAGIDTQNYITVKESIKNKINDINQQRSSDLDTFNDQASR